MTDRVFPASKQAPGAANGTAAAGALPAVNGGVSHAPATKTLPYNQPPPTRQPYRQPYHRRHHHRRVSCRRVCCCCCFWSILIFLIIALMAAIAATAFYVIYHPRKPIFSVPSFRIHRLNLTTSADSSVSHLSSLFNFTLIAENPNSHLTLDYDPFAVSIFSSRTDVFLGNGTVPAFFSGKKNHTSFRSVIASSTESRDLVAEEVSGLRSDLRRPNGVEMRIQMDTMLKLQMGKLRSKRVGIRVVCEGFKGSVPRSKKPTLARIEGKSKCKVDLRVKLWKWTF